VSKTLHEQVDWYLSVRRHQLRLRCRASSSAEVIMLESADFVGAPQLDFAAWRTFLRLSCGDQPGVIDPPPLLVGCAPAAACERQSACRDLEKDLAADVGRIARGRVHIRIGLRL
jgi:hypothetical protein